MNIVDKMREIKAMQAAMHGKVIKQSSGNNRMPSGGKWEIVEKFKGKSHEDGGIDLEVDGGYVRKISGVDSPDDIAKNGRVWRSIGATAYGVGEGLLDTITLGATDQLTDYGYKKLQDVGGSSGADEKREQDSLRGYGTAAGAITGAAITGGATTGSAIQQGAKGVGAGVSKGSPDSRLAQQVGAYLPLAGQIAGMAYGNAGYAKGSGMADFAKYANVAGKGFGMTKSFFDQQGMQQAEGFPSPVSGGLMSLASIMAAQPRYTQSSTTNQAGGVALTPGRPVTSETTAGYDLFHAQVPMREDTLGYLTRYNINA